MSLFFNVYAFSYLSLSLSSSLYSCSTHQNGFVHRIRPGEEAPTTTLTTTMDVTIPCVLWIDNDYGCCWYRFGDLGWCWLPFICLLSEREVVSESRLLQVRDSCHPVCGKSILVVQWKSGKGCLLTLCVLLLCVVCSFQSRTHLRIRTGFVFTRIIYHVVFRCILVLCPFSFPSSNSLFLQTLPPSPVNEKTLKELTEGGSRVLRRFVD